MKKGFTLLEMMIVIIVSSILLISLFKYYDIFVNINNKVENRENMKLLIQHVDNVMSDIDKVKAILTKRNSTDTNLNYWNENDDEIIIYTNDNLNKLFFNQFDIQNTPEETTLKQTINNFWSLEEEDLSNKFLDKVYVYNSLQEANVISNILIQYRNFTFIYIDDEILKRLINNNDFDMLINECNIFNLNEPTGFLSLNLSPNIQSTCVYQDYLTQNYDKIKNNILIYKYSTKRNVVNVVKKIEEKMEYSRKSLMNWAQVKAGEAKYNQNINESGDWLNRDLFITCISDDDGNCQDNPDLSSIFTLLPNDDSDTDYEDTRSLFFNSLDTTIMNDINYDYGFILFNSNTREQQFNADLVIPTTNNNCFNKIAYISPDEENGVENYCMLSKNIRNLVERDVNPFYPIDVWFYNIGNPISTILQENGYTDGDPQIENTITAHAPIDTDGHKQSAPYFAVIVTQLPNDTMISKKIFSYTD